MNFFDLTEASYQGNIGMMELMKFMKQATPEEKNLFDKLMDAGAAKKVWQLVQKVTGTNLQGAEFALDEVLKKVDGKWALVSKSNPKKVLQYYRGPKDQKPSDEWVSKVERRVHAFEGIPRNQMPQIHIDDIKGKYNYKQGKMSLDNMQPVQTERLEAEYAEAVEKIQAGKIKPIMLDRNRRIVNGHHRYDAYKDLGYEKVSAVIVDATLEELMKEYSHTTEDNKLLDKPTPTVKELADKHSVDAKVIMAELVKGIKVELEHTSNPKVAREIALDHINEMPDYYTRLAKVEEAYSKPNFDFEWDEAKRYPEFREIGKEEWIKLASKGEAVTINTAKDINNTDADSPESFYDLDKDKQKRVLQQVARGNVEMPIIAVYSDSHKELIGGNTRLTAMMLRKGSAKVWMFEVPDEVAELAENFADGKVKGKSRPGRVKKAGASCKGSVSSLRAKAKKYSGERGKMYHWCANMKGGKKK